MILLLDNRDSFTFNLEHALLALGAEVRTVRSTDLDPSRALALEPAGILIGPGPGTPRRAGCIEGLVQRLLDPETPPVPTLGICLGHQALATATGARLSRARDLLHGQTRAVEHDGLGLFETLPNPLHLTGYNSLVVEESTLAGDWHVSARNRAGEIEALRHNTLPLVGIQAHPESILAKESGGMELLRAFVDRCKQPCP